jgi:hypothetical protein
MFIIELEGPPRPWRAHTDDMMTQGVFAALFLLAKAASVSIMPLAAQGDKPCLQSVVLPMSGLVRFFAKISESFRELKPASKVAGGQPALLMTCRSFNSPSP